jgi:hypothetical protein
VRREAQVVEGAVRPPYPHGEPGRFVVRQSRIGPARLPGDSTAQEGPQFAAWAAGPTPAVSFFPRGPPRSPRARRGGGERSEELARVSRRGPNCIEPPPARAADANTSRVQAAASQSTAVLPPSSLGASSPRGRVRVRHAGSLSAIQLAQDGAGPPSTTSGEGSDGSGAGDRTRRGRQRRVPPLGAREADRASRGRPPGRAPSAVPAPEAPSPGKRRPHPLTAVVEHASGGCGLVTPSYGASPPTASTHGRRPPREPAIEAARARCACGGVVPSGLDLTGVAASCRCCPRNGTKSTGRGTGAAPTAPGRASRPGTSSAYRRPSRANGEDHRQGPLGDRRPSSSGRPAT